MEKTDPLLQEDRWLDKAYQDVCWTLHPKVNQLREYIQEARTEWESSLVKEHMDVTRPLW